MNSPARNRDLAERILEEAVRLFGSRGFSSTSVQKVAEASGCTKPAVYYHFANKEALFLAAVRHEADGLSTLVDRYSVTDVSRIVSIEEVIREGLRSFFAYVEERPTGMKLLMRAELQREPGQPAFDIQMVQAAHHEILRANLEVGVARGELRDDLHLDDAAAALSGIVDQRMQQWLQGVSIPADLADRIVDIFFRGVLK